MILGKRCRLVGSRGVPDGAVPKEEQAGEDEGEAAGEEVVERRGEPLAVHEHHAVHVPLEGEVEAPRGARPLGLARRLVVLRLAPQARGRPRRRSSSSATAATSSP